MPPLTARQQEVLDYVATHARERGKPPTIQEIGRALAVRSTSGVHRIVSVLVARGHLTRARRESRGLSLPAPPPAATSIPLLGDSARDDDADRAGGRRTLSVDPCMLGGANPVDCLAAPAANDLPTENIRRGDILLIELTDSGALRPGELVAVRVATHLEARALVVADPEAPVGRIRAVVRLIT